MELSDVLNSHHAMYHVINDTSLTEANVLLESTSDFGNVFVGTNGQYALQLFQIKELPDISNSDFFIMMNFTFSSTVTWLGDSGTSLRVYMYWDTSPASGKFRVNLKMKIYGGTTYSQDDIDLDPDQLYAFRVLFVRDTGTDHLMQIECTIYEVDSYGVFTIVSGSALIQYGYIDDFFTESDTAYVYTRLGDNSNVFNAYIYELELYRHTTGVDYESRLFSSAERTLIKTYSTTYVSFYLFPPQDIFEGTAYDHTLILEGRITDLESDVATLQSDLDDANLIIDTFDDPGTYTPSTGDIRTWWNTNKPGWWNSDSNFFSKVFELIIDLLDQVLSSGAVGTFVKTKMSNLINHLKDNPIFELTEDTCS